MSNPAALIVIPARIASTRLSRKMLLDQTGTPLILHTLKSAMGSALACEVVVATDDAEIFDVVTAWGGRAFMTDVEANSGTDRVAEVALQFPEIEIFVNVQGDEPEIEPASIDLAISSLASSRSAQIATLATPIRDRERLENPNCVKVVLDADNHAMYFSRSLIPYPRQWDDRLMDREPACFLQHVGLYAYRREFLMKLGELSPSPLEEIERLEQLRFLQNGYRCAVAIVDHAASGIDTQEDYDAFVCRTTR